MARGGANAFDDAGLAIQTGQRVDWYGDLYVHGVLEGDTSDVLANNAFLEAVNAAGTANLDLLKADASDNTVLNAASGKVIDFQIAGTSELKLNAAALFPAVNVGTDLGTSALGFGQVHLGLGKTVALKTGSNAKAGTFTANGTTPVTVSTTAFVAGSVVILSLKTVGGTVGALPHLATATAGTGFTVVGTALDTSVYNWAIIDTEA